MKKKYQIGGVLIAGLITLAIIIICQTVIVLLQSKSHAVKSNKDKYSEKFVSLDNDPWEYLPDGRVIIEIHGQRLAFPTDEKSLESIKFSLDSDAYKDAGVSPTLRHVLAEPGVTRHLLKEKIIESL